MSYLENQKEEQRGMGITCRIIYDMMRAIEEKWGKEGLQYIGDTVVTPVGRDVGKFCLKLLGMEGEKSLTAFATAYGLFAINMMGAQGDVKSMDDEKGELVIFATYCPIGSTGVARSGDDCPRVWRPLIKGFFEAVNPNLTIETTSRLSSGDECCNFIFRLKK